MNILVIVAEVSSLLLIFYVLYWLVGILFKQLKKVSAFSHQPQKLATLRQNLNSLLVLFWGVLSIAAISINAWWLYQGKDLREHTLKLVSQIPPDFWWSLGFGIIKSLCILLLARTVLRPLHGFILQICDRAKQFEDLTTNTKSIDDFFGFLDTQLANGIWLFALVACTRMLPLPGIISQNLFILLKIYIVISVGVLIFRALSVIIDTIDAFSRKFSSPNNILRFYDRLQHLIPFFKRCLEFTIYVGTAALVAQQIEFFAKFAEFGSTIVEIIAVIFLCRVLVEVSGMVIEEVFFSTKNLTTSEKQRRLTILPLLQSLLKYILYFSAGIGILYILSIDPAPILAAAGILGLAVSLGAQNLVNDIVSGFFILFENYYLVGDFIETGDAMGVVEAIELRTTRIRHPGGQVYILRNGDVTQVVNYSKDYVRAVVDVRVPYSCNLDRVYRILEEVGQQLKAHYPEVLEPTEADGVEDFEESAMVIRTTTKVKPGHVPEGTHDEIQGIVRKYIKEAFDREGIQMACTRRVAIMTSRKRSNNHKKPLSANLS